MQHYNTLAEVPATTLCKSWRFRVKILRVYSWYSSITKTGPFWTFIIADEAGTKMELIMYADDEGTFKGLEKQEGKWVEIFKVTVSGVSPGFNATRSPCKLSFMPITEVRIIDPLNDRHYMDFKSLHEITLMSSRDRDYPVDAMGVVFDTEALLDDNLRPRMVFHIRDINENQIKCVATWDHAVNFGVEFETIRKKGQVIVVLKMWKVKKIGSAELWLKSKSGLSDFRFNPRLPEVEEFRQSLLNNDAYVRRHGIRGLI